MRLCSSACAMYMHVHLPLFQQLFWADRLLWSDPEHWTLCSLDLGDKKWQHQRVSTSTCMNKCYCNRIFFVQDFLSYTSTCIFYFWSRVQNLVAYENHACIHVNETPSLAYENLQHMKVRERKSTKLLRVRKFLQLQYLDCIWLPVWH